MRHSPGHAHRAGVTEVTVKALQAAPGRCLIAMATAPSCGAAAARRAGPASWREAQAQRLERAGGRPLRRVPGTRGGVREFLCLF